MRLLRNLQQNFVTFPLYCENRNILNTLYDTEQKFKQLFDAYYGRLIVHALRFVDTQAEAEDVVGDVFYELWKKIDTVDLDSGMVAYLYRAVTTRALNVLRHKNVAAVRIEMLEVIGERRLDFISEDDTERDVESEEIARNIRDAVNELPERCRQIFILSYVNGLKNKEIADAMNISVRTVEAQIYKALRFMREKLKYLLTFFAFLAEFFNG